ncbi:MAG: hypothetical protein WBC91_13890 [Phototrophicaceae bacterium]
MPTLVTGHIHLPAATESFTGATVFISLDSVGMMDMPATTFTETIQHNVTYEGEPLAFSVEGQMGDSVGPFNLRVHISTHNSDDVQKGDYLTKRTYYVLKDNHSEHVDVNVELV